MTSRYILGGSSTGAVKIWDLKNKSLKKTYDVRTPVLYTFTYFFIHSILTWCVMLQNHHVKVTSLMFNWKDSHVASGSESGEIIINNVVSGVASAPLVSPKSQVSVVCCSLPVCFRRILIDCSLFQAVRKLAFSHYKKYLLAACYDSGSLLLWDTSRQQLNISFASYRSRSTTLLNFGCNAVKSGSMHGVSEFMQQSLQGVRPHS